MPEFNATLGDNTPKAGEFEFRGTVAPKSFADIVDETPPALLAFEAAQLFDASQSASIPQMIPDAPRAGGEDRPTPQSVTEGVANLDPVAQQWAKSPNMQKAALYVAEGLTFEFERATGLSGPTGSLPGYNPMRAEVKGAMLDSVLRYTAPLTPYERQLSLVRTGRTMADTGMQFILGRLSEIKANNDARPGEVSQLQQYFAEMKGFASRLEQGDPAASEQLMTSIRVALSWSRPGAQNLLDTSALLGKDASEEVKQRRQIPGFNARDVQPTDLAGIEALIWVFSQQNKGGWVESLNSAWRGSYHGIRAEALGLDSGRGMISNLPFTHPDLGLRLAGVKALQELAPDAPANPEGWQQNEYTSNLAKNATVALGSFARLQANPVQFVRDEAGQPVLNPDGTQKTALLGTDIDLSPRPFVDKVASAVEHGVGRAVASVLATVDTAWQNTSSSLHDISNSGHKARAMIQANANRYVRGIPTDDISFASIAMGDGSKTLSPDEVNTLFNPKGDLIAWIATTEGMRREGQIEQEAQQFSADGEVPQRMLDELRQFEVDTAGGITALLTQERLDELTNNVGKYYAEQNLLNPLDLAAILPAAVSYATMRTAFDINNTLESLYVRPTETIKTLAVVSAAGYPIGLGLNVGRSVFANKLGSALQLTRARTIIGEAGRRAPELLERARDNAATKASTSVGQTRQAFLNFVDRAETLLRLHDEDVLSTIDDSIKDDVVNYATVRLRKTLKELKGAEQLDFFAGLNLGDEAMSLVGNTNARMVLGVIREAHRATKGRAGDADFFTQHPDLVDGLFRTDGQSLAEAVVSELDEGASHLPNRSARAGSEVNDWLGEKGAMTAELRGLVGVQRTQQHVLLSYLETKTANRRRIIQAMHESGAAPDAELLAAAQFDEARIRRMKGAHSDSSSWMRPQRLSQSEWLSSQFEADELLDLVVEGVDDMGLEGVYMRIGTPLESYSHFVGRLHKDLADPTKSKAIKRDLMRNYFDSEGMPDKVNVDSAEGRVLSREEARHARNIAARYQKDVDLIEAAAIDSADLDSKRIADAAARVADIDDFGGPPVVQQVDLKKPLERLRRLSESDRAQAAVGLMETAAISRDGSLRSFLSKVQGAYYLEKNRLLLRNVELERLGQFVANNPEAKKVFHKAIDLRSEKPGPQTLKELKDAFPEEFADLPTTQDELVQEMLTTEESFRAGIAQDMVDAGLMSNKEARSFVEDYSPQSWAMFDRRVLDGKPLGVAVGPRSTASSTGTELLTQRDPSHWRALIHLDDAPPVQKKFKTKEDAEAWLTAQQGLKDLKRTSDGDFAGKTDLNHQAELIHPIGEELTEVFGAEKTGTSLFKQIEKLIATAYQHRIFKAFDRPGVALEQADLDHILEFNNASASDYTAIPLGEEWGALQGKYVHRDTLNSLRQFTDEFDHMRQLARSLDKEVGAENGLTKALYGAKRVALWYGKFRKQQIITKITRDPQVMAFNVIGDKFIFGHGGTEGKIRTSIEGTRARTRSWATLKALRESRNPKKTTTPKLDDDLARATAAGILDEDVVVRRGSEGLRQLMVEEEFGKSPGLLDEAGKFFGAMIPEKLRPKPLKALMEGAADEQLDNLIKESHRLARLMDDRGPGTPHFAELARRRAALDVKIKAAGTGAMQTTYRLLRGAQRTFIGRKGGRFGELKQASRELYADLSLSSRLDTFFYWIERGFTDQAAAKQVNRFMQTFSAVPGSVRRASQSGFANPVAGFLTESARIFGNWTQWNAPMAMGSLAAIPTVNFMTMLTVGVNPYEAEGIFRASDSSRNFWQNMQSQMLLPAGGEMATLQVSPMQILPFMRMPGGFLSGLLDAMKPEGFLGTVAMAPVHLAANLASGVTTNEIGSLIMGTDPASGRRTTSRMHTAGQIAESIARASFPSAMPLAGGGYARFWEDEKRAPLAYSGNMRTFGERLTQLGFQTRLRTELNFREKARWAITEAKQNDSDHNVDRATDPLYFELRNAIHAKDKAEIARIDARMEEQNQVAIDLDTFVSKREWTDRDRKQMLIRLDRMASLEKTFPQLSLRRKADVVLLLANRLNESNPGELTEWKRLARQVMLNARGTPAAPTNPTIIGEVISDLEAGARSPILREEQRKILKMVAGYLRGHKGLSEAKDIMHSYTTEEGRRGKALFEETYR